MVVESKADAQSARERISRALTMPTGAITTNYTDDLNTELQYLDWYENYLGSWECVASQDPTVMEHGGYVDCRFTIHLNGESSYGLVVGEERFYNGSTTSDEGNYVLKGSKLMMRFNGYWSTFRHKRD